MSFTATVLRVMIASPSDTTEARDAVERALMDWSAANSRNRGVVLQPWRWETNSVPVLGGEPQALINSQGLDDADIVFALFGSKLGSPTAEAVSGTVEEIEKAVARGVPVHLFFSTADLPHDVDLKQVEGLRAFKLEVQGRGLYGEYANPTELAVQVWKAVEHDLATMLPALEQADDGQAAVSFDVQGGSERSVKVSTKGVPKNTSRTWIDVTNRHDRIDAEGVTFAMNNDSGIILHAPKEPITIHAGQTRRIPTLNYMGRESEPKLTLNWLEGGQPHEKTYDVG